MASDHFNRPEFRPLLGSANGNAYQDGYQRVMRELAWARSHGFVPTERQLVLALTQTTRVYEVAQRGKAIAGRHPEWLHGRADALRELLRRGVGMVPEQGDHGQ